MKSLRLASENMNPFEWSSGNRIDVCVREIQRSHVTRHCYSCDDGKHSSQATRCKLCRVGAMSTKHMHHAAIEREKKMDTKMQKFCVDSKLVSYAFKVGSFYRIHFKNFIVDNNFPIEILHTACVASEAAQSARGRRQYTDASDRNKTHTRT